MKELINLTYNGKVIIFTTVICIVIYTVLDTMLSRVILTSTFIIAYFHIKKKNML